jgi:uncharacterized protein YdeI (YjbR/CyaY-like superfamily)
MNARARQDQLFITPVQPTANLPTALGCTHPTITQPLACEVSPGIVQWRRQLGNWKAWRFPKDAMKESPKHHFFATPDAMRLWLEANHRTATELYVGYTKRHAVGVTTPSITWPESIAEALCFGWIDGVRRTLNEDHYSVRFTPRRPGSKWSALNIRTVAELEAAGKMTDSGRAVFHARKDSGSPGYQAQKKVGALDENRLREFNRNESAWTFFAAQPPGYQKAATWWVMEAKREETRDRRLAKLIEFSSAGKRVS